MLRDTFEYLHQFPTIVKYINALMYGTPDVDVSHGYCYINALMYGTPDVDISHDYCYINALMYGTPDVDIYVSHG